MLTREEMLVIYEAGFEAVISVIQRLETIINQEERDKDDETTAEKIRNFQKHMRSGSFLQN